MCPSCAARLSQAQTPGSSTTRLGISPLGWANLWAFMWLELWTLVDVGRD